MSEIIFETLETDTEVKIPEKLIFGRTFTTHIFEMDYDVSLGGWNSPKIKKLESQHMSPAAMVLHYGQAIFEGLKAFKQADGKIAMFRPDKNIERMNNSARRLCMPELDPDLFMEALTELVKIDKKWVPTEPGYSLYIRPLMYAYDPFLGVRPGNNYKFIIMLSPVGPYYPEGFKPVPIMVTDKYVRATAKGVGDCKCAGNYAASLLAQREAQQQGYTQVLWLDAIEQKYIEEVGTMNIFIQFKDEVVTPKLNGSILPGITRLSVIQILKDWGYNITERDVAIDEVVEAYEKGNLMEIFGTGTAAVISSLSKLKYNDTILMFNENEAGELGQKLYKEITDIQYGKKPDSYKWMLSIE
ncbi:MAG: branched-chain amino acid aminotransferase [Melioribacteraceae bacterium]|nr:branched-chain amino acid aminotransferase [Melioribacteraceae bacterium]